MAQTAEQMAKGQRDISIAEFFEKNRHLLGFDNKRKALLTTIKEAVDNSLDACEEAGILPEILIEIVDMGDERYRVIVEDNGPGIVRSQIPKIFAKLLYGSKFHRLKQSRGQQGIGISASVMYGQLTTGRPAKITSKIASSDVAHYFELRINTQKNKPEILRDDEKEWNKTHGTRIELDLTASYLKGNQSVDEYIRETAIVNPHVTIIYTTPKAEQIIFQRATEKLPLEPKEIMPHPYGVELGTLIKMLNTTPSKSVQGLLTTEFSRVS
ncbi:MAG: DNA topoisomerase VI subunit B [Candidatus Woesearchaeota archaeon]